jgi:hypothetical protein
LHDNIGTIDGFVILVVYLPGELDSLPAAIDLLAGCNPYQFTVFI